MPQFPGVYQAKALRVSATSVQAQIPQVFGDALIRIDRFIGLPPVRAGLGWVAFVGGNPEFPVWSTGSGVVSGTPGAPGPPGEQGPEGPQGPPGESNAVYTGTWTWTTKTADAANSGQVGINQSTWAAATQINLNEKTSLNADATAWLAAVQVGDEIRLQQKTDASRWAKYLVTALPTDQGAWWSWPVTYEDGAGNPPGGNADTLVSILVQGGTGGGTGTDEVWIGTADPIAATPTIELWYDTDDEPAATDQANFWNTAWGRVAHTFISSSQTGISTGETVLTGSTLNSVLLKTGRRYKVSVTLAPTASTTDTVLVAAIRRNGSRIMVRAMSGFAQAGVSNTMTFFCLQSESSDSTNSFDVTLWQQGGSGTVGNYGDAAVLTYFAIEDIGPITAAAVNPPAGQPQVTAAGNALGIVALGSWKAGVSGLAQAPFAVITDPLVFTPLVGRRYRIIARIRALSVSAASNLYFEVLRDGATTYQQHVYANNTYFNGFSMEYLFDGDGVQHSFTMRGVSDGALTFVVYLDQATSYFALEDVGPNSTPALPIPDTPPAWIPASLQNGWVNYGGGFTAASYRKIGDEVQIRGLVTAGTVGQPIFTLPAGFRPSGSLIFACDCNATSHYRLDVQSGGAVLPNNGNNAYMSISGVRFSVTP